MAKLVSKPRKQVESEDESEDSEQEQEEKPEPQPEPEPEDLEPPKLVRQSRRKQIMPSLSDDEDEVVLVVKKKAPRKPRLTKKTTEKSLPEAKSEPSAEIKNDFVPLTSEKKIEPVAEPPKPNVYEEEMRKFRESMDNMSKDFQKQLTDEKARFKEQHEREKAELAREKAELSNMRAIKFQSLLKF